MKLELQPTPSSFRDPAGFVVNAGGVYKRIVTQYGREDYSLLMESGLYGELVNAGLLIPHVEEDEYGSESPGLFKLLRPEQLEFISYPYEWSFSQLKDAALLTLDVQKRALRRGLSLKDASAFNVQFRGMRPVFLDTLSFERDRGGPWVAYEQFCRHFLAPLLLGSELPFATQYLRVDLSGFPLEWASRALNWRSYLKFGPLVHIHLHARANRRFTDGGEPESKLSQPANTKAAIAESLTRAVERLKVPKPVGPACGPPWMEDYDQGISRFRSHFLRSVLRGIRPCLVYDLGGAASAFGRLAASEGCRCILCDPDPIAVDRAYREGVKSGNGLAFPLVMDLRNPSPALGFGLVERQSFFERPNAGLVLALGMLHHLRLSESIPFAQLAETFARFGSRLLIEFASLEDEAVRRVVARRPFIPDDYSLQGCISAFSRHFKLLVESRIPETERWLLLFGR